MSKLMIKDILAVVSKEFDVDQLAIVSPWRLQRFVKARHAVCYLAFKHTTRDCSAIAIILKRERTTVIHAIDRVEHHWKEDTGFNYHLRRADAQLKALSNQKPQKMEILNHV